MNHAFGRVVDHLWYAYAASADPDRYTYGYDRASNRLYRENTLTTSRDELYGYDQVNRLVEFARGDLNNPKSAIENPNSAEDWSLDMTGNWPGFVQKTSGDAVERYVYSPYGVVTIYDATWTNPRSVSSYANVTLYIGRELDAETGLYYYRNRYYGGELGRFVSRDPMKYEAGDMNVFRYLGNASASRIDPSGLSWLSMLPGFGTAVACLSTHPGTSIGDYPTKLAPTDHACCQDEASAIAECQKAITQLSTDYLGDVAGMYGASHVVGGVIGVVGGAALLKVNIAVGASRRGHLPVGGLRDPPAVPGLQADRLDDELAGGLEPETRRRTGCFGGELGYALRHICGTHRRSTGGKQEGAQSVLLGLLPRICGPLPDDIRQRLNRLPLQQLEELGETLLDLRSLDDLRAWLDAYEKFTGD